VAAAAARVRLGLVYPVADLVPASLVNLRRVPTRRGRQLAGSRPAVDEMRDGEGEDSDAGQEEGDGEDAGLVAVAAEMADGQHGQHEPDVVDVLNEAGRLAGQPEAALDLRNDGHVVGEVGRAEQRHEAHCGGEEPDVSQPLEAAGMPGSDPAAVLHLVGVARLLQLVVFLIVSITVLLRIRPRLGSISLLDIAVGRRIGHMLVLFADHDAMLFVTSAYKAPMMHSIF